MMLDRIRACLSALAPAEQRVARLVLEDPREFAVLPVGELAARAQVSKPTVVRFCRSVGYDGLADFKRKLAGSVNEGVPFVHRAVDDDDEPALHNQPPNPACPVGRNIQSVLVRVIERADAARDAVLSTTLLSEVVGALKVEAG